MESDQSLIGISEPSTPNQQKKKPETYKKIRDLGKGSFGRAYLVECGSDKSQCVIKQMDMSNMSEEERKDTLKEARIMEVLNHPNIIRFKEVYKTKQGKLCIVMDFADGGDLSQAIKNAKEKNQPFSEAQILDYFTQICLAIKHIHDRKILHRDLKAQNIFLMSNGMVKLGDFGIARVLSNTKENASTIVGTPYYLSPEIIENKPYSFKSDIWSLGVILYELCALKPPFDASSLHMLALRIVRGNYPPLPQQYSKDLKDLVKTLMNQDVSKRPNINQILSKQMHLTFAEMKVISQRAKEFLSQSTFMNEFSHTVLHGQDAFEGGAPKKSSGAGAPISAPKKVARQQSTQNQALKAKQAQEEIEKAVKRKEEIVAKLEAQKKQQMAKEEARRKQEEAKKQAKLQEKKEKEAVRNEERKKMMQDMKTKIKNQGKSKSKGKIEFEFVGPQTPSDFAQEEEEEAEEKPPADQDEIGPELVKQDSVVEDEVEGVQILMKEKDLARVKKRREVSEQQAQDFYNDYVSIINNVIEGKDEEDGDDAVPDEEDNARKNTQYCMGELRTPTLEETKTESEIYEDRNDDDLEDQPEAESSKQPQNPSSQDSTPTTEGNTSETNGGTMTQTQNLDHYKNEYLLKLCNVTEEQFQQAYTIMKDAGDQRFTDEPGLKVKMSAVIGDAVIEQFYGGLSSYLILENFYLNAGK